MSGLTRKDLARDAGLAARPVPNETTAGKEFPVSGSVSSAPATGRVDRPGFTKAGAVRRYPFKDGDQARTEPLDGLAAELAFGGGRGSARPGGSGPSSSATLRPPAAPTP